ncbi:MAG: hypothetical protein IPM45_00915 [Acidimicrobiales bacterium]|nr:hypothetical protein [Acidimicrobiales bacterium]
MRWWRVGGPRVSGDPRSANGASSFHLWWGPLGAEPLVEVSVRLEVVVAPAVPRLYFWALQAGFHDGHRPRGAAHLGLQWHPSHPGSRAVNWGGYRDPLDGGGELRGSLPSALPSATRNPNTRDLAWQPGRPYRLRISPAGAGAWRGEVIDEVGGVPVVVRDLVAPGDRLTGPVVWSEVFARCEHPSVEVRWSGFEGRTAAGEVRRPERLTVTYQSRVDGGCDNTTVVARDGAVSQVTSTERSVPPGSVISLSDDGAPSGGS